jgi:hypothetical protein
MHTWNEEHPFGPAQAIDWPGTHASVVPASLQAHAA